MTEGGGVEGWRGYKSGGVEKWRGARTRRRCRGVVQ